VNDAEHAYTPPRSEAPQLPEALMRYLDGGDLLHKTQALRLSTVDAAGWPHAALLSAGDVLAVSPQRLRFALFAQSTTAANLARDGRVTLALALDRGMCEVRLHTRRLAPDAGPLALFEATVDAVRTHLAPYADMSSGLSFSLHQPEAVHARWLRQLAALKSAH
jgi:hypothetical protein